MSPTVETLPTLPELVARVRERLVEHAQIAIEARGRFTLVLAGGSTPAALYRELSRSSTGIDWSKTLLFFGDERHVAPTHDDSNYRMVRETLLDPAKIPPERVHRIEAELDADVAAQRYETTIRAAFAGSETTTPSFDLVLLGLGEDLHTASLFPGTPALKEQERLVVAQRVPKLGAERITLSYPAINAARAIWFLVTGERKASAARDALQGNANIEDAPVRGVTAPATWWLDQAAAALLDE